MLFNYSVADWVDFADFYISAESVGDRFDAEFL